VEYNEFLITVKALDDVGRLFSVEGQFSFELDNRLVQKKPVPRPEPLRLDHLLARLLALQHGGGTLEQAGRTLYDDALHGPVGDELRWDMQNSKAMCRGLRIRLSCSPGAAALPWELLHDGRTHLALEPAVSVVRGDPSPYALKKLTFPLRILVIAASPRNCEPLNVRAEIDSLLRCWSGLIRENKLQPEFVQGPDTVSRVRQALANNPYEILHFISHGQGVGGEIHLVLEDSAGNAFPVAGRKLYQVLLPAFSPRLVVLNLCQGAAASETPMGTPASAVLEADVPAVLAHQTSISDDSAAVFSRRLYAGIVDGMPLDEAVAVARRELQDRAEWPTPVLFLRHVSGDVFFFGANPKEPPLPAIPLRAAQDAGRRRYWGQAASYAGVVQCLDPESAQAGGLRRHALAEEALDGHLAKALWSVRTGVWPRALEACREYRACLAEGTFEDRAGENAKVEFLRLLAQAALGIADPCILHPRSFPYGALVERGIHPRSSTAAVQAVGYSTPAELAALRILGDPLQRLMTDFFLHRAVEGQIFAEFAADFADPLDLHFEDLVARLKDDAGLVLLLAGRRADARRALEDGQWRTASPARMRHGLALVCYADAVYPKESSAPPSGETWERAMAWWVAALADDAYWETWCLQQAAIYGLGPGQRLTREKLAQARERLRQGLVNEVAAAGSRVAAPLDAGEAERLTLLFEIEWRAAKALAELGGLRPETGTTLTCGPLLLRLLGLEESLAQAVGRFESQGQRATMVRRLFSPLARAAVCLELGRPAEAWRQLEAFLQHGAGGGDEGNQRGPDAGEAARLAADIHLALARDPLRRPQPSFDSLLEHWRAAVDWARLGDCLMETIQVIGDMASEGTRNAAANQSQSIAWLDLAVELLGTLAPARLTAELADQLVKRAVRSLEDGLQDASRADLERAFRLSSAAASSVEGNCTALAYQARAHKSREALERAEFLARVGAPLDGGGSLAKLLDWISDERTSLFGPAPKPEPEPDEELPEDEEPAELSGAAKEAQECTASAAQKQQLDDLEGALGDLERALRVYPGFIWALELAYVYCTCSAERWLRFGHIKEARELLQRAQRVGVDPALLRETWESIRMAEEILGEHGESEGAC
jgi:tetratricopeptide (TPR) repeat protein